LFTLINKMRATVFVFAVAVMAGVQAGCEWYKNCGACVADSGCGWCSNDPAGVGSGTIESNSDSSGKGFASVTNEGTQGDITETRDASVSGAADYRNNENGVQVGWLVNVRGQYENITSVDTTNKVAVVDTHLSFEGTGYIASPYFGQTWGGADRSHGIVGIHKTKFTQELRSGYTVTPYTQETKTVSSVQSDTQATMQTTWANTFSDIEFQIGNIGCSGTISYPDTSQQDVYGSWPPNPTKFTTELKDGYTIKCTGSCGGTNVRVATIYNDQHLYVNPRFTTSFNEENFAIELGPLGTGLISGTSGNTRIEGQDPCKTSMNQPCYENTRFLTELRINDRVSINVNQSGTYMEMTVASIRDDAHVMFTEPLTQNLHWTSKFKIMSFHNSPFTYARSAQGGLQTAGVAGSGGLANKVTGYNGTTFTRNLMAGYGIILKVPGVGWERRIVTEIDSATTLQIDEPFSAPTTVDGTTATTYNYESCPSLTYENFDLRTENGPGVIQSDGTNHVYDNVQYSMIRTYKESDVCPTANIGANINGGCTDKAAMFTRNLKVGYTVTMDSITRTVTKVVSDTLIHVDRAFKENVQHNDFSYRFSVRKTGDYHLHWKPASESGAHQVSTRVSAGRISSWNTASQEDEDESATETANVYSRQTISDTALHSVAISNKQDKYLLYPPVCYNSGRCVPKTSHSLVGVETDVTTASVLSSVAPHMTDVYDYVSVTDATEYYKNCKPQCTVTVTIPKVSGSTPTISETRRVKTTTVNSTFIQVEAVFRAVQDNSHLDNYYPISASAPRYARVRYVTGTGTVSTAKDSVTVTGASKETKTKFNSEFSSGWTITIGCGGATCTGTCSNDQICNNGASCTTAADCVVNGKVTGATCTAGVCTAETKNITSVSSDTRLQTTMAFSASYAKVDYTIGNIPGLGYVTNSQNSKIIDGNDNTRFLEQLKVGYTITSMMQTRTITAITSNRLMTVNEAFSEPGITSATSYKFSGKKGTGEVSVDASGTPKVVDGTLDVTQTQFQNELSVGYLMMIGEDYKVITKIESNTKLEVESAFIQDAGAGTAAVAGSGACTTDCHDGVYTNNDYNYESCWLDMGKGAGIVHQIGANANSVQIPGLAADSQAGASYTNKKVYVEDACEIKPGCCGFKISSVVHPDRFAYYKIRPPHTNMKIRVVVKTTDDNVDLVVKKSAVPTTSSYDYKSVRESNPWALTVPQEEITCPAWGGSARGTTSLPPANCDYWYIGVRGDNRYPQKTGASEYDLYVITEFDWPNFLCSDANSGSGDSSCKWLGISKNEDANMVTNDDSQAVMRLTPNANQAKGSMFYSTKVHLYDGFETSFQFKMSGFSVGCNSVLYPSGFCGGGDGFAFVIQKYDDTQIGCTGSALGYARVDASKQGNDWARHRCVSVDSTDASATACDVNDDGSYNEQCAVGTLCNIVNEKNGGCGTQGLCGFQSCTQAIGQALAVEFDTWNNLKLHDPKQGVSRWWINATEFVGYNDNHVAIFSSNAAQGVGFESDHALNEHFAATPSIPNLADGKNHTVKIKYWPQLIDYGKEHDGSYNRTNHKLRGATYTDNIAMCGDCEDTSSTNRYPAPDNCYACKLTNSKPGNFAVFIDDMKRPVLQTSISLRKSSNSESNTCYDNDLDRCVLDENGNAYIGFTAATGGERANGRTSGNAQGRWDHVTVAEVATDALTTPQSAAAIDAASAMLGAAQNHEILNWVFCNNIGCVPI